MATVPSQTTFTDGNLLTAGQLNSNVRDATNFLIGGAAGRRPTFRVTRNATQSIANATEVQVLWDTVITDTDSGYSTGTGLYTINTAGFWLFQASTFWAANGTGNRAIHLAGASTDAWEWMAATVDGNGRTSVAFVINMAANQTVASTVYQTSGAALNFAGGANTFGGVWLSS
ncbi:MAG: C1q-like domain-containing protein [Blastococcus sp.]